MKHDPDLTTAIAKAVARLKRAEPVIVPTESVYGVACDARSPLAIDALRALKGRPASMPLPLLVSSAAAAQPFIAHWPRAAQRLADEFWPGPLTIVVPASQVVSRDITAGRNTVALRCPAHPAALALATAFQSPLALSSANRTGAPPATNHKDALRFLKEANREDLITLDGGQCESGIATTIVELTEGNEDFNILRVGAITKAQLQAALQ